MSAHTPGPLFPRKNSAGMWELCIEDRKYAVSTAFICAPGDAGEADARLYAAAPDLLAALQELADTADRCDSWQSFPSRPLDDARAAIAKATGSQP